MTEAHPLDIRGESPAPRSSDTYKIIKYRHSEIESRRRERLVAGAAVATRYGRCDPTAGDRGRRRPAAVDADTLPGQDTMTESQDTGVDDGSGFSRRDIFRLLGGAGALGAVGLGTGAATHASEGTNRANRNRERGGTQEQEDAPEAGELLWTFPIAGGSSPTIVDGVVYVVAGSGTVHALRADDGEPVWEEPPSIGNVTWSSAPSVAGGTVYVASLSGTVYAIDAATGEIDWSHPLPRGNDIRSSPTVHRGTVFVGDAVSEENVDPMDPGSSLESYLYALDAESGAVQWEWQTGVTNFWSATAVDGVVYHPRVYQETDRATLSPEYDIGVYALDAASGTEKWNWEPSFMNPPDDIATTIGGSVTVADGRVYATVNRTQVGEFQSELTGYLATIGAQSGAELGLTEIVAGDVVSHSTPAVADGVAYVGGWDHRLEAVPGGSFDTELKGIESSPTVADGVVYFSDVDPDPENPVTGNLYAWDTDGAGRDWQRSGTAMASPIVHDGVVYFVTESGLLAIATGSDRSSEDSRVCNGTIGHHDQCAWELDNVRLVQTVEDTEIPERDMMMTDIGTPPSSVPDLAAKRNTTVLFEVVAKDPATLPDEPIELTLPEIEESFELDADTVNAISRTPTESSASIDPPPEEVFDDDGTTPPPVWELDEGRSELTIEVPDYETSERTVRIPDHTLESNEDFTIQTQPELSVGFVQLRDPDGGSNYGDDDGRICPEGDDSCDPDARFEDDLESVENVFEILFPVPNDGITARGVGSPIDGTTTEGDYDVDFAAAHTAVEDAFPATDFDETFVVVPDGYFEFHNLGDVLDDDIAGLHFQQGPSGCQHPPWSSSLDGSSFGLPVTAAHEAVHHFLESGHCEDLYSPVWAQDDDEGGVDTAHAADGVVSTGFWLSDGSYSLDPDTKNLSLMAYGEDRFIDTLAYQRVLEGDFEPVPPITSSGSEQNQQLVAPPPDDPEYAFSLRNPQPAGDERAVLYGIGRVDEAGAVTVRRLWKREGEPMSSSDDAPVSLASLDRDDAVLDSRGFGDSYLSDHADEPDDGKFTFVVPFPDDTRELRADRDGVETRLNPVVRTVRDEIEALPDVAFEADPAEARDSLETGLDEVARRMDEGDFEAATHLLTDTVRGGLESRLDDAYEPGDAQPDPVELSNLVVDSTRRVAVIDRRAFFEIRDLDTPERVRADEAFDMRAKFVNTAHESGAQDVEYRFADATVDTRTLELERDATDTVTFSHSVAEPGEYELGVHSAHTDKMTTIVVEDDDSEEDGRSDDDESDEGEPDSGGGPTDTDSTSTDTGGTSTDTGGTSIDADSGSTDTVDGSDGDEQDDTAGATDARTDTDDTGGGPFGFDGDSPDSGDSSSGADGPGFGIAGTLAGLGGAIRLLTRQRGEDEADTDRD